MRTIPRDYSCDPALTAMANSLPAIDFGIEPDERASFFQLESWRNVSFFRDKKTYRVRLYIGGKARIIGITLDGPSAARFADAARFFFWQYRLRDCRPPCETDMNFSLAQAEQDIAHTYGVHTLLVSIRDHLAQLGELKIRDTAHCEDVAERKVAREQRRTARGELALFLREHAADTATMRAENKANYEQLKVAFHHILEQLAIAAKAREAAPVWVTCPPSLQDGINAAPAPGPDIVWCAVSGKQIT